MSDNQVPIEVGGITRERASEAIQRLTNSHFNKSGAARCSIPASADDDDLVASRFVDSAFERIETLSLEIQSLLRQRDQMTLLARNQEWRLAPDLMTADQHAAVRGAYFDREGNVHRIGEREPDGKSWLWVVPNAFKQAFDAEVARESEHQAK